MKITRRQLRRIIKEAFSGYASERPRNPMERHYASVVEDYESWVQETGHITPSASSVLVTYLIDQGLEQDTERIGVLASEYKMDKIDVDRELKRQAAEAEAGIIDDAESFRRGFYGFYEGTNMKITKRQLRRIIREELTRAINEGKCDKASGHEGCIRKREKGWVVLSNDTGKCWGRSKKDDDAECTYYDSEEEAKEALGGYHRG